MFLLVVAVGFILYIFNRKIILYHSRLSLRTLQQYYTSFLLPVFWTIAMHFAFSYDINPTIHHYIFFALNSQLSLFWKITSSFIYRTVLPYVVYRLWALGYATITTISLRTFSLSLLHPRKKLDAHQLSLPFLLPTPSPRLLLTYFLYRFAYHGHFIRMKSHNMWSLWLASFLSRKSSRFIYVVVHLNSSFLFIAK